MNTSDSPPFKTCLLGHKVADNPFQQPNPTPEPAAQLNQFIHSDGFSASYRDDSGKIYPVIDTNLEEYLSFELSIERLDKIFHRLWMCGLPRPPRPLHHQLLLDRQIVITEKLDMHLVWGNGKIYIKPIPRFLLDPTFWQTKLVCEATCSCEASRVQTGNSQANGKAKRKRCCGWKWKKGKKGQAQPEECPMAKCKTIALGFLFSYTALISHESDFAIALSKNLIPQDKEPPLWSTWRKLVKEILQPDVYDHIDRRFIYGELRLERLNWIYRFHRVWKFRPYHTVWQNYSSFFRDQLGWVATTTVYIVVVLTAMQVGITTEKLAKNETFQAASYGFSVFAILGPIGAAFLILLCFLFKLVRNYLFSAALNKLMRRNAPKAEQPVLIPEEAPKETV